VYSPLGFSRNCRNSFAVSSRSKLVWILPGLLWLWLFAHLSWEWTLNSQYTYGWAVPFFAAVIFYFRWQRRPAPDLHRGAAVIVEISITIVLLFLLPIRIVEEANPDWRLLGWILALCAAHVSLLTLYRVGGKSWLKHFAFAVCFPLVGVPWPVQFENFVVQTLMRAVAFVAVEIAGWFGIGAYQLGNVIQLRNGFVGVDEACSGVKTLQAGIMVALVLGELLQMRWKKRIALLVLGCGWVFFCNVFRATALVFVAARNGLEVLGHWHDFIGTAALLVGMMGMLALAWFWKGELYFPASDLPSHPQRISPHRSWVALAWLALVFAGAEAWYRVHERDLIERPPWQARWPEGSAAVTPLAIPESTKIILHYDNGKAAAWEEPPGIRWWSFFAAWKPQRAALQLVRSHSPEICLPAIGRTFRHAQPDVTVSAHDVSLDFRSYEFEQNGRPLFVFVCIQEDKRTRSGEVDSGEWNLPGRLRAAWQGKRNLGQRLLEIAVLGYNDFAQARGALSKTAGEVVVPGSATTD
jgi:exosortase